MFPGPLGQSLAGEALARGVWSLEARDIREQGLGRHRAVDDTPAGGGPGMVMRADVLAASLDAAAAPDDPRPRLIMSPRGRPFRQAQARQWSEGPGPRHRLPTLRGGRRAGDRGALPRRGVGRRLCALWRRNRRSRRTRRLRPAHSRRDGEGKVQALRKASKTACLNTRITPVRANGKAAEFPKFCSRATMPRSPTGAARKPSASRARDART